MLIIKTDMATFGSSIKIKCVKIKWKETTKDTDKIAKSSLLSVTMREKYGA